VVKKLNIWLIGENHINKKFSCKVSQLNFFYVLKFDKIIIGDNMRSRNALVTIHILFKSIINVYFDTFFVLYFFKVANYNVVPLVKYYFTLYLFLLVGFILVRKLMKKNIKVPCLRIGISLQAIYVASIMLLKENIINYVYLVAMIRGISNGFYYYPNNLLNAEKIENKDRHKFDSITTTITSIASILMPLILGFALTYMSYIEVSKIFFILFIVMFILSFFIEDAPYTNKKMDLKGFFKLAKKEKIIKDSLIMPFLGGLTHLSGAFVLIITLTKVINFNTSMSLGIVESICAIISLIVSILYSLKIDNSKKSKLLKIGGYINLIILVLYTLFPSIKTFILVLLINSSFISLFTLIDTTIGVDIANYKIIKTKYKEEYMLAREIALNVSRCIAFLVVLISCIIFDSGILSSIIVILGFIMLVKNLITSNFIEEKNRF